MEIVA